MTKKTPIPEDSIPLRVVCCALSIIAISASFIFGEAAVPIASLQPMHFLVISFCVWLCVGGGMLSYNYRQQPPAIVETAIKIGAGLLIANLCRELWFENIYSTEFQFLRPLLHALVGASILTSFELRTRNDIGASAAFGLFLMVLAASSGKSIVFGAFVFLYLCLGAVLLYLSCKSESRAVTPSVQPLIRQVSAKTKVRSVVVCLALLPLTSVAAFSFLPRMDAEADSVASQVRSLATGYIYDARKGDKKKEKENFGLKSAYAPIDITKHHRLSPETDVQLAPDKPPTPGKPVAPTPAPGPLDAKQAPSDAKLKKPNVPTPGAERKRAAATPSGTEGKPKPSAPKTIAPKPTPPVAPKSNTPAVPPAAPRSDAVPIPRAPKSTAPTVLGAPKSKNATAFGTARSAGTPPIGAPKDQKTAPKSNTHSAPKKVPPLKPVADKPESAKPAQTKSPQSKITRSESIQVIDANSTNMDVGMSDPEEPLFSMACNRSVYVKLTCFDNFDGSQWKQTDLKSTWDVQPTEKGLDFENCPPLMLSEALPVVEIVQNFKMESNLGSYVPVGGVAERVSVFDPAKVDAYGSIQISRPLMKGTEYTAVSMLPVCSPSEMRKARQGDDPIDDKLIPYLQVPENISANALELASQFGDGPGNRFVQAEHIVEYLRKNYQCSLEPAHGTAEENRVDTFLFSKKKGDCKDFASAFIMLCRANGIPARLVVGFSPGEFDAITGQTHFKRKNGHAWAEIYMPPYGWVAFDPVPGGLLPARPEQQYYNYETVRRQIQAYSKAAHNSWSSVISTVLAWLGYLMYAVSAAIGCFLTYRAWKSLRPALKQLAIALKGKHPAVRVRDSVHKQLKKKLGIQKAPADTESDILAKLNDVIRKRPSKNADLETEYEDFVFLYNAVYFGEQKRMPELKQAASRVIKSL